MSKAYDSKKNQENIEKHGLSFTNVRKFEWETATTKHDTRLDYGEDRFISYGMIEGRLHALVWTVRNGEIRPISFRKANAKERKRYEKEKV